MDVLPRSLPLDAQDASAVAATAATVTVLFWFMTDVPGKTSRLLTALLSGLLAAATMAAVMSARN